MVDNDYNIIKPVESLKNIVGLSPTRRREQRRGRQDTNAGHNEEAEQQMSESSGQADSDSEPTEDRNGRHSIDYCA